MPVGSSGLRSMPSVVRFRHYRGAQGNRLRASASEAGQMLNRREVILLSCPSPRPSRAIWRQQENTWTLQTPNRPVRNLDRLGST